MKEPTVGDLLNSPEGLAVVTEIRALEKAERDRRQAERDDDFLARSPGRKALDVHPDVYPEGSPEREARIAQLARYEQAVIRRVLRRHDRLGALSLTRRLYLGSTASGQRDADEPRE